MDGKKPRIGVLSLQGAVNEHYHCLKKIKCTPVLVKKKQQLKKLDGLIIPGGESTTIGKLLVEYKFVDLIRQKAKAGMGIFGTCAGMILLADKINGNSQPHLELINITVERNTFGRQIDSFEAKLNIPRLGPESFPAIFIRAPEILKTGKKVETLTTFKGKKVLARQGRILVSSFHPELTADLRLHRYFLSLLADM